MLILEISLNHKIFSICFESCFFFFQMLCKSFTVLMILISIILLKFSSKMPYSAVDQNARLKNRLFCLNSPSLAVAHFGTFFYCFLFTLWLLKTQIVQGMHLKNHTCNAPMAGTAPDTDTANIDK